MDKYDSSLLMELRNRSKTAWSGMHRLYKETLLRVCERMVGNSQVAEEIANDAIEDTWRKAPNLTTMEQLEAYLRRAARNKCLNELRRDRMEKKDRKAYTEFFLFSTSEEADDAMEAEFRRDQFMNKVLQAIRQLPKKQQEAFLNAKLQDYNHAQETTGTKRRTLFNQVNTVKNKLKQILGPCIFWEDDTSR